MIGITGVSDPQRPGAPGLLVAARLGMGFAPLLNGSSSWQNSRRFYSRISCAPST